MYNAMKDADTAIYTVRNYIVKELHAKILFDNALIIYLKHYN